MDNQLHQVLLGHTHLCGCTGPKKNGTSTLHLNKVKIFLKFAMVPMKLNVFYSFKKLGVLLQGILISLGEEYSSEGLPLYLEI